MEALTREEAFSSLITALLKMRKKQIICDVLRVPEDELDLYRADVEPNVHLSVIQLSKSLTKGDIRDIAARLFVLKEWVDASIEKHENDFKFAVFEVLRRWLRNQPPEALLPAVQQLRFALSENHRRDLIDKCLPNKEQAK